MTNEVTDSETLCGMLWWLVKRRENKYVSIEEEAGQFWLPEGISEHRERLEYLRAVTDKMVRLDFIEMTPNADLKCRLNGQAAVKIKRMLLTCEYEEENIDDHLRKFTRSAI